MLEIAREDAGRIEVWTVTRPAVANALDRATFVALDAAIEAAEARVDAGGLRAVIVAGAARGKAGAREVFLAGADLREVETLATSGDEAKARAFAGSAAATLDRMARLAVPVIAAIGGDVYGGGCEVAVACDVRIAEASVQLAFRQARMGLACGWGGARRLARLVGPSTAKLLLLTSMTIDAERALRVGLVDEVVAAGKAMERAREIARACAQGGPKAIAALKESIDEAFDEAAAGDAIDRREGATSGQRREIDRFVATWRGEEHREALAAMREKRAPKWG